MPSWEEVWEAPSEREESRLLLLRQLAFRWKKLVFASPAYSHNTRERCRHLISFWIASSS